MLDGVPYPTNHMFNPPPDFNAEYHKLYLQEKFMIGKRVGFQKDYICIKSMIKTLNPPISNGQKKINSD